MSAVLFTNIGSTGYYLLSTQIDGQYVFPKWQGAASPASLGGDPNSLNVYTWSIMRTSTASSPASAIYTILGSKTQFQ
jgi:hypothetical protein